MATTGILKSLIVICLLLCSAIETAANTAVWTPPSTITPPIATVLSGLGFQDLAAAAAAANFSATVPVTIFAPTQSSLLTCPSCSLPRLLGEHSIPGLYPLRFLRTLAFGTKIETLEPDRCLTVTASPAIRADATAPRRIFINGVEVTKPDLFNNGLVIVHGIRGFVSHLSPFSCVVESMITLSFPGKPPSTAAFLSTHFMLKDAMMKLRTGGYSVLALAMRVKYSEISDLNCMTLFAVDDISVFMDGGGHDYVAELGFHIVPNRLLTAAELMELPTGTVLPTMEHGRTLVVTTAGGGGPLGPMRINYVKVKSVDVVNNNRIAVHGMAMNFRGVM